MKNLRELFTIFPLDCESFGAEWLRRWEGIGRLLQRPARLEFCERGQWIEMLSADRVIGRTVGTLIASPAIERRGSIPLRVVLLDSTVVYEWGPK